MPEEAWGALAAERRALRRAVDAARLASYVYQDEQQPMLMLTRQLAWAKEAAFPSNRHVDETTQRALLREIETQTLFHSTDGWEPGRTLPTQVVETVPLSQIGEDRLLTKRRRKSDAASDASSSWVTLSSNASSNFTSVSGGSLDGELIGRFGGL